eukprot:6195207-Amphidinium_carterae.1
MLPNFRVTEVVTAYVDDQSLALGKFRSSHECPNPMTRLLAVHAEKRSRRQLQVEDTGNKLMGRRTKNRFGAKAIQTNRVSEWNGVDCKLSYGAIQCRRCWCVRQGRNRLCVGRGIWTTCTTSSHCGECKGCAIPNPHL